jgi:hypothetical protein
MRAYNQALTLDKNKTGVKVRHDNKPVNLQRQRHSPAYKNKAAHSTELKRFKELKPNIIGESTHPAQPQLFIRPFKCMGRSC